MKTPPLAVLAALAAPALLGGCRTAAPPVPPAAAPARPAAGAPATLEEVLAALPAEALEGLTPEQRRLVAQWAQADFCACGCPHSVSSCLRTHPTCTHAPRMVRLAARVAATAGATAEAIRGYVDGYYAAFDRRARIALDGYGPPLGNADAPITMVEYSDFTCPYCQQLRPALEAFVQAHADRVKLFFKPFPIEAHPGALDAALAGEWARGKGLFWPMHDALFSAPDHGLDALAGQAEALGADAADLRDAVATRRGEARVRASQAEGQAAGVHATPTLFLDGRRLELPDQTAEWLLFTLEDEEEWRAHRGGWERD